MWAELIVIFALNKYYKLDVIGKYGNYFIFIPKAVFWRNIVAQCLSYYSKIK